MKISNLSWRPTISAATLCFGFVFGNAAMAHVFPKKQEPSAGATVAAPAEVKILFDGPLEPSFSSLTVTDAAGKTVTTEKSAIDAHHPDVAIVALPPLNAGRYTVHWVAVAADGHRTHGDYPFNVK
jgi:methionine-rich copper-binding protein CopC